MKKEIETMDMSRVTFPSIALIHHTPETAFELIAAAGYKNTDVLEKAPHMSIHPDEFDLDILKAAAEKHGLGIPWLNTYVGGGQHSRGSAWLHHPGFQFTNPERYTTVGFGSDDPEKLETELQHVYRAIDMAVYLGARGMRFTPGDDDPAKMDKYVPWLKKCAEYAEKNNVYMGTENHDTGIMGRPERLVELFEKIGSPYVGVIYEPYNLMEQAGYDYRKAFEVMRDHIVHVHLKDGKLMPDRRNYKPTLMGEGEFDFRWVMKRLNEIGYDGPIALEYEVAEVPPEEGLVQFYNAFKEMVSDL
jgi:sugar phosphate isomerase/epimerase